MLTEKEIAAIRERCENVTPGPWEYYEYGCKVNVDEPYGRRDMCVADIFAAYDSTGIPKENTSYDEACAILEANGQFIAHARQDIPALLDALAEANERISILERAVKGVCECCVHNDDPIVTEDSPCFKCEEKGIDHWAFDKVRFSKEGGA